MNALTFASGADVHPRSADAVTILLALSRGFAIGLFSLIALVEIVLTIPFVQSEQRRHARAVWLHRWCQIACRILGLRLARRGQMPRRGLLVCNHLSYLDIIALSALQPCVFVAKGDVASWPVFGWLARAAGTIFVDRTRRSVVGSAVTRIGAATDAGLLVVLFPEGTSSDGRTVLPFKSSLLEPALHGPLGVGAIDYSLREGSVADEVCYWRDMTLAPHLANLFTKRTIEAEICFASATVRAADRKALARELRGQVIALRARTTETSCQFSRHSRGRATTPALN